MLPRRCKKCRCFIAPQLARCPRCRKLAPALATSVVTKEDRIAARAKRDAKVPVIYAKHMHWIPSAFARSAHTSLVEELQRRLGKTESVRLRNTIRSELRAAKAVLARTTVPKDKKPWTTEIFHTKQMCVSVFISPKKHRYVLAERDGPADLIIVNRKNKREIPFTRLQRFEHSRFARMKKLEKHEEVVHKKRKKAKKDRKKAKAKA